MDEETATLAKTWRIGGSMVITLPTNLVKDKGLEENEIIEIKVKKQRKDYFGALKGIGKFTRKDRMEDRI